MKIPKVKLTEAKARAYIKSGGAHCPFCKSVQTEGGPVEISGAQSIQGMWCLDCEEEWEDIFERVQVVHRIPVEIP